MEYAIKLIPSVQKEDLPKLKTSGIDLKSLWQKVERLKTNPYTCSKSKSGDLSQHRAMNWKDGYRIIFEIDEDNKEVIITSIDKHDNAYKKAKKRTK